METILNDLRYGYRTLLRNPGFTAVAVLSLALGIGANTAIFSFINTVLLQDLPVASPHQLTLFGDPRSRGIMGGPPDSEMDLFSWQEYQNFRKDNQAFGDLLAVDSMTARVYLTITGEKSAGTPESAQANLVSGNFFDVLGVKAAAGRFFDANADKAVGASPWIVLNDDFWERRFHRSSTIIGEPIHLAGRSWTVLGVAPRGFFGIRLGESPDLWIPISMKQELPGAMDLLNQPMRFLNIMGRLKPGLTPAQAQANVNVLLQQMLPAELGASPSASDLEHIRHASVKMTSGAQGISDLRSRYDVPLRMLMVVVGLVLLIACANVANLLLALAAKRQKEFALRYAIGAGRSRIVRQLLTESVLLAASGGFLGILFANAAGKLLVHLISTGSRALPLDFNLDQRVLAFTVLISIAAGVVFGLVPAFRASRVDLNSSLKEAKASMASPRKVTLGRALVAGQVALSLGLLVTAGLLLHSFANLIAVSTGFERDHVLIFKIDTASSGYKTDQRLTNLYQQIEDRVSRLPGVTAEGVSMFSFAEGQRTTSFKAPGVNLPEEVRLTSENFVSPGYFETLRVPMVLGRPLRASDSPGGPLVAVISESFANTIFGSAANAVGRNFTPDDDDPKAKPFQIVGVARDVKVRSVHDKNIKMAWISVYQSPAYLNNLAVRVKGDPSQVASAVRRTIQATERNLPIRWTTTLADEVSDSLVRERAIAQLSSFFAALALARSAVGLYGTISF
ncbi:MAG TPA: ABC transporter permease, partial [Bryobacteraceae bacterium]|nr:ABC transporter permease [Bryobacteraceae bacterium]